MLQNLHIDDQKNTKAIPIQIEVLMILLYLNIIKINQVLIFQKIFQKNELVRNYLNIIGFGDLWDQNFKEFMICHSPNKYISKKRDIIVKIEDSISPSDNSLKFDDNHNVSFSHSNEININALNGSLFKNNPVISKK